MNQDAENLIERLKEQYLNLKAEAVQKTPISHLAQMRMEFEGFSDEEIDQLRRVQGVEYLPALYQEFMRVLGKHPGSIFFLAGFDNRLGILKRAKKSLARALSWNSAPDTALAIPANAFIFADRNGSQMFFFRAVRGDDDPPVYAYRLPDSYSYRVAEHLSEWLFNQAINPWTHVSKAVSSQAILTFPPEEALHIPTGKISQTRFTTQVVPLHGKVPTIDESFGETLIAHYRQFVQPDFPTHDGEFIGLSDNEIAQVQNAQGVKYLPPVFRHYLRVMGQRDGGLFTGADRGFEALRQLKQALRELMKVSSEDCVTPKLPKNAFVFLAYQSVEFFFFEAKTGLENPPVLLYIEEESQFLQVSETLSDWLWHHAPNPLAAVKSVED